MATHAKYIKTDCAYLRSNVASLGNGIASLESELKSDSESLKNELKSNMSKLESDIARNADELKAEMKAAINISHTKVMYRAEACESHVVKGKKSVVAVPEMVRTVVRNMNKRSGELNKAG